jgi:hypothetical protein
MIKKQLCILGALFCATLPFASYAETDRPMDAATRSEIIDVLSQKLLARYIFLDQAQAMVTTIHARQQRGEYDNIVDGQAFADKLTGNLQDVAHDKHLEVVYSTTAIPVQDIEDRIVADAKARAAAPKKAKKPIKWTACPADKIQYFDFGSTECLPGNIGYLVLNGFIPKDDADPFLAAAMNRLANTHALIIDLRDNGGGDSDTVSLLSSYFFDHPVQLDDFYIRETDRTEHNWTNEKVAGKKYGQKKDVYILTSSHSFSAAEGFSYDMQAYKRATLIGETTLGGAHPISILRLEDHFEARVPFVNSINPVTKTNWEGIGVKPDIPVQEYDALYVAQVLELRKIMKSEKNAKHLAHLNARVTQLQDQMAGHESIEASR